MPSSSRSTAAAACSKPEESLPEIKSRWRVVVQRPDARPHCCDHNPGVASESTFAARSTSLASRVESKHVRSLPILLAGFQLGRYPLVSRAFDLGQVPFRERHRASAVPSPFQSVARISFACRFFLRSQCFHSLERAILGLEISINPAGLETCLTYSASRGWLQNLEDRRR